MSETENKEIKETPESTEEVKQEQEEVKEVEVTEADVENDSNASSEETGADIDDSLLLDFSPFVTEDDRFDIFVACYKDERGVLLVDRVDEDFKEDDPRVRKIKFVFKNPNQGDCNVVTTQAKMVMNEDEKPNIADLTNLEWARLMVLIRSWSLVEELNNANLIKLSPKVIRSVVFAIRDEIGLEGII